MASSSRRDESLLYMCVEIMHRLHRHGIDADLQRSMLMAWIHVLASCYLEYHQYLAVTRDWPTGVLLCNSIYTGSLNVWLLFALRSNAIWRFS